MLFDARTNAKASVIVVAAVVVVVVVVVLIQMKSYQLKQTDSRVNLYAGLKAGLPTQHFMCNVKQFVAEIWGDQKVACVSGSVTFSFHSATGSHFPLQLHMGADN